MIDAKSTAEKLCYQPISGSILAASYGKGKKKINKI
jgi:hypothetical protein